MELLKAMEARRSIRKFKTDPVPDESIKELINAGKLAPSGTNIQPTRYVIIKSEDARAKLMECTPLPFVAKAPVIIACCIDNEAVGTTQSRVIELREAKAFVDTPLEKELDYTDTTNKRKNTMDLAAVKAYLSLNAAIAIDHITLRAVDLGLGSCWIMMFDREKVKNLLGLGDRYETIALIPIGYPDQDPGPRPRLAIEELLLKEI